MARRLPAGTVTLMFTDIEGSTRLLHELGPEAYARALAEHRRVLRSAFARYGGVEVDTEGDAFFIAFPTAKGAVSAALDSQRSLANGSIKVRMGVHTGTPQLAEEGYVGEDVHKGARIAAAGHGGQVLLSKETRELVDEELIDLGEHRLKDFTEPVWIFQLGMERFPPLKTISNTNLPHPASSFVGREGELAEVTALIQGGARLITELDPYRWAPTFAFLDPDGMELSWETVARLAQFRKVRSNRKAELWMLFASGGIVRTLVLQEDHQPSEADLERVTRVTGTTAWMPFYELRRRGEISARAAREAYVNLMRWRLESVLGYEKAHALEVPNQRGVPLYHMIFATDHHAGNDIMTNLYQKASARIPVVRDHHKELARGLVPLFDAAEYVVREKYAYSPPIPPDEFLERFARGIPDEP